MQPNIFKTSMTNGLILGVLFSVNFLLNISNNVFLTLLSYGMVALIIVATYKLAVRFRENDCGGIITYGRSFSLILLSFFFAAIIASPIKYIYFQFINPGYLESMFAESITMFESLNFTVTEEMYTQMESVLEPIMFTLQYIWVNTFLGILLALLLSFFVKKDKGIFEE